MTASASSGAAWSALRYPAYRWFYMAQFISLIGSSMQLAAVNWQVWELTRDELALGFVGLARVVPIIILSLLGGVVADAVDRRVLQVWTSAGMLVFAGILAVATLTGGATLPLVFGMTALIAGMVAFDQPARTALLPNLVPEHEVANAVRLNVLMWQITAVAGPVVAGLLIDAVGPGWAYAFNALSFLPVVAVMLFIRVPGVAKAEKREISLRALGDGIRFVQSQPLLWSTMLLDFFATFFSSALALLPVYATDILRVGADGYGILYAAPSVGATIGAIVMTQRGGKIRRQGELMLASVGVYGLATIVFGMSSSFAISLLALAVTGLADSISTVIRGTLRQLLTPDAMRGRMLSVNMIFFMGGPQLGEFEAGALARVAGAPFSVISGGVATILVVAAMWAGVPQMRRYREADAIARAAGD